VISISIEMLMPPVPVCLALPFVGTIPIDVLMMPLFPITMVTAVFVCIPVVIIAMLAIIVASVMIVIVVIVKCCAQIRNWNQQTECNRDDSQGS